MLHNKQWNYTIYALNPISWNWKGTSGKGSIQSGQPEKIAMALNPSYTISSGNRIPRVHWNSIEPGNAVSQGYSTKQSGRAFG